MKVWIVAESVAPSKDGWVWDFHGVFDTEQEAVDVCADEANFWIGPIDVNQRLPRERQDFWPGAYYVRGVTDALRASVEAAGFVMVVRTKSDVL